MTTINASNKRVRLDDADRAAAAVVASVSGRSEKLDPAFRTGSPDELNKAARDTTTAKRQKLDPEGAISDVNANKQDANLSAKYQAALRRIVELELKACTSAGDVTKSTSPSQQLISEDVVAIRLQQMKQGPGYSRPTYEQVGVISEDLVAARLAQTKLKPKKKNLKKTAQQKSQKLTAGSSTDAPTTKPKKNVTKETKAQPTFAATCRPICPITNTDYTNANQALFAQQFLNQTKKQIDEDKANIKLARMIF